MLRAFVRALLLVLSIPAAVAASSADAVTLVACAPGYPGTTAEAQKAMDALAAALGRAAGTPDGSVSAVYFPREAEGLARLGQGDAGIALVPVPFYLAHRDALRLRARLSVETTTAGVAEQWSLVAQKGRVKAPADLGSMTVASIAGYAPDFVRGAVSGWGRLPESTTIVDSAQVLSMLRKAAKGPDTAVLLDGAQASSLGSLPFAAELEEIAKSAPMPTAVVATVGDRVPEERWGAFETALLAMSTDPAGIEALRTIRMVRFAPLDREALVAAESAWRKAAP